MKRLVGAALTATLAALGPGIADARDTIRIVGSSTVFPYTRAVADAFVEAGHVAAPDVVSTGTGGGMALFCQGLGPDHPDITGASRAMTREEWELCRTNGVFDISEMLIGYDGLTVASARTSPHDFALTPRDLYLALAAEVPVDGALAPNPHATWADVREGLPDIAIRVMGPPPSSGTRDSFIELAIAKGCLHHALLHDLQVTDPDRGDAACSALRTDGAFIEAGEDDEAIVAALLKDPELLGVFGYSYLYEHDTTLKGATINGIAPDLVTIAAREYPLSRPLFLYIKNDHRADVPDLYDFLETYAEEMRPYGPLLAIGLVPIFDDTEYEASVGGALDGVPMSPPES